jgi:hypothetical protein
MRARSRTSSTGPLSERLHGSDDAMTTRHGLRSFLPAQLRKLLLQRSQQHSHELIEVHGIRRASSRGD